MNAIDSKTLTRWIGDDEEDTLIAYSEDLSDNTTRLMATMNDLQGIITPEQAAAINRAAGLMARLSVDMKAIHRELFPR